jgi:PAS domain S-box-containing protein
MANKSAPHTSAAGASPAGSVDHDRLGRRERALWLCALSLLAALAIGLALDSWDAILTNHLEALPVGLLVLVFLFVAYAWRRNAEIAELRGILRGIEGRANAGLDAQELDRLFGLAATSQQGFRDLVDTFEDLLISISPTGLILRANRSLVTLLNRPFAEVIGRPLDEFFEFPDSGGRPEVDQFLPRFLEHRRWTGVLRVRVKRSGVIRFFDCMFHPVFRDGAIASINGIVRDITRDREIEARFKDLFATLPAGVYLASQDDCITDANPAFAEMFGFGHAEDVVGMEISSLYAHPKDRGIERSKLDELGFLRGEEIILKRHGNGREPVALHTAAIIRDPGGKFVRYQGSLVDITEQRGMERTLHREQEFARRLIDSFPDLIIALDRERHFTFASPQISDILGYLPEELIGQKLGGRTEPHDRRPLLKMFRDLISGRRADGMLEYSTMHKNGSWRLLRATARPMHDQRGRISGVIASARDITEQVRLQQQLIQSERLAAMGQMIAGVAHELNNPLTAILGITELLRDRATDPLEKHQLDLGYKQARRAAHIVQSLLIFSRPATPRKTLLHLSDLLQRTIELHEHSLRSNQIALDMVPRPDLPTILGDVNQLTQVFLNLIVNAEQAIREVRDSGVLRIRMGVVADHVLLTFQDDGVGLRRETLPRIFDPFFTTKRPGRGTGLGLSICMAIVREHNGDISAHPLPTGGSVFTVSLPICTQSFALSNQGPTEKSLAAPIASRVPVPLAGKRILVIDDEDGIRDLVLASLAAYGVDVQGASSSDQALELAGANEYDAILCDLHLTNESGTASGIEVRDTIYRMLAARSAAKPVFIMMTGDLPTALTNDDSNQKGGQFLQKPFQIGELISLLADSIATVATLHSNE